MTERERDELLQGLAADMAEVKASVANLETGVANLETGRQESHKPGQTGVSFEEASEVEGDS